MGLKYQENVTIPFDMCDVQHEIKLPAFISYCLGVSGRQSESVGRSDVFIFEEFGLIWVVTDYEMNIHRLPTYNETITIVTERLPIINFSAIGCSIFMMKMAIFYSIFSAILC